MIDTGALVESLGGAMVRRLTIGRRTSIRDVVLADSATDALQNSNALVLGHGVDDAGAALDLLKRSARETATGVVLRAPVTHNPAVAELADTLELDLIELQVTASWTHLIWLARSILDHSTTATGTQPRHISSDYSELFTFADAAAAIVSAPVTIEDAHSRVLAYSEAQEHVDPARISTIVGRRVPESIVRYFRSRGVFRRLHTSDEPIWVEAGPGGVLPRLIIPIRAGRELLGSIWVADPGPVPEEQLNELTRTASVVALHLLRLRAVSGAARRMAMERLRAALITIDDEPHPWLHEGPWRVVVLARDSDDDQDLHYRLELWELTLRRFGWAQPEITEVDGVALTVVADPGSAHVAGTWAWLRTLSEDMRRQGEMVVVVAGAVASRTGELFRSRTEAVELLSLARGGLVESPSTVEDVWQEVVIARAVTSLRRATALGSSPITQLKDHDARHGTSYVQTLAVYLAHFHEPKRAARLLDIHPNTLRYRIKRVVDRTGIDLDDNRLRLALQLQSIAMHNDS